MTRNTTEELQRIKQQGGGGFLPEVTDEEHDAAKRAIAKRGGYTEAEESCKGCMGPCGMCDTVIRDARELEEIVRLGERMRAAQKLYFRDRSGANLDLARRLEREFDVAATKKLDEKPEGLTLFGNVGGGA